MVTVLKFAMPTLLRLKSRVLAAEEGKLGEREGYGEYEDTTRVRGGLRGGWQGGIAEWWVAAAFLRRSFAFLPSSAAPDG